MSIKLISPFRYPGGKTWLVPVVSKWLESLDFRPLEFIEPFCGGGIVGLNIAYHGMADRVLFVELDENVASVWNTIVYGDAKWLANKIVRFKLTRKSVLGALSQKGKEVEDKAFQTILRNRINRGGIIARHAGMLKNGDSGRGINSRWYPNTLRKRILSIWEMRNRIEFTNGDGIKTLQENAKRKDVVFFIDPPYTAGGKKTRKRLYNHFEIDHEELFRVVSKLSGDFLMTHGNDRKVRNLALQYNLDFRPIMMKSCHHVNRKELLIGRDLSWFDEK